MVLSDGAGLHNQLAVLNNLATCSAKLPPSKANAADVIKHCDEVGGRIPNTMRIHVFDGMRCVAMHGGAVHHRLRHMVLQLPHARDGRLMFG